MLARLILAARVIVAGALALATGYWLGLAWLERRPSGLVDTEFGLRIGPLFAHEAAAAVALERALLAAAAEVAGT